MVLTRREQLMVIIANGISAYSVYLEMGQLPKNTTVFDFILGAVPEQLKPELDMKLVDEIFDYISHIHKDVGGKTTQ